MTFQSTIDDLIAGNLRFLAGTSNNSAQLSLQKLQDFAHKGQRPKAVVLCCSDSRAPVEMIFDQDIGDLFVIRVAGNIIAPSLVGSVEFAVTTFDPKLVVVMGHSQCGAIQATINHIEYAQDISSENIYDIVSRIKPYILPITKLQISKEEKLCRSVEANVIASVSQLSYSSRLLEGLVSSQQIKIIGAVLDITSGKVEFLH